MSSKNPKGATGKERMRRKPPADPKLRPRRSEFDVKKALTPKQLAEIGAISMMWNQIEGQIQFIFLVSFDRFFPRFGIWLNIVDTISSLEQRIDILRSYASECEVFSAETKTCIKNAFDAVLEYRTYRNGIVHSHVYDHEKGIAVYIAPGSKPWQILVTEKALSGLYDRLVVLRDELREVDLLFRMAGGEKYITVIDPVTKKPEPDQQKALRERSVPQQTAKAIHFQNKRKSLPPLPKFPDAHLVLPETEAVKIHLDLGETDHS